VIVFQGRSGTKAISIQIQDTEGRFYLFVKSSLPSIERSTGPAMPRSYQQPKHKRDRGPGQLHRLSDVKFRGRTWSFHPARKGANRVMEAKLTPSAVVGELHQNKGSGGEGGILTPAISLS
jgi:hypothetical protein